VGRPLRVDTPPVSTPRISVIVPTNNREALLRETIASILAQDWQDFELIIVDNISTDGTETYVGGIGDPRVRYYRNANGGIPAVSRNLGIRHARGEYVAFCDDDDIWLPVKLSQQFAVVSRAPEAGLCFTNGIGFRGGEIVISELVAGKKHLLRRSFAGLLMENCIPSSSVMVRSSALERTGGFDEAPELVAVEDWELWLRIARQFRILFLDQPLVRIRIHESLTAKPSVTVRRNMIAIHSVSRKLTVNPVLCWTSLAYQWLKHGWFRLMSR
jgi:teichuronic acid biosynthesis glycosyltransferase TuaG